MKRMVSFNRFQHQGCGNSKAQPIGLGMALDKHQACRAGIPKDCSLSGLGLFFNKPSPVDWASGFHTFGAENRQTLARINYIRLCHSERNAAELKSCERAEGEFANVLQCNLRDCLCFLRRRLN